ncbi:hypothetical protein [Mycolicibacterium aromaticivorans]|nr:hypothetical protein [Mycolicibacterium aromaticivorans]
MFEAMVTAEDLDTAMAHAAIEARVGARPRYGDVAALLAGAMPEPPRPTVLMRDDGRYIFYPGALNLLYGDPASAKTWVALAAVAETLIDGGTALFVDMDNNGMPATVGRLLILGVPKAILASRAFFRYSDAADDREFCAVVADCTTVAVDRDGNPRGHVFVPDVAVVDCSGEVMASLGADSNSAEDFTRMVQGYLRPLMRQGTCVILIDHSGKGAASRKAGAAGTFAKRRIVDGLYVEARVKRQFVKGRGGITELVGLKDRHSGVLPHSAAMPDGRFNIGQFELVETDDGTAWYLAPPSSAVAADESGIAERRANDYLPAALTIGAGSAEFTVRDLAKARFGGGAVDRSAKMQARRGIDDLLNHGVVALAHAGSGTATDPARYRLTEAHLGPPPANTVSGAEGDSGDE